MFFQIFPFLFPFRFLNSQGFGHVTYFHSKLLSESINTLEELRSDQLVKDCHLHQKTQSKYDAGIFLVRQWNSHTKSNFLSFPSRCGHQKAPFSIHILYRLPCFHIYANYFSIREKGRHGMIYFVNIFFPDTN
jgi:hypothetical protein